MTALAVPLRITDTAAALEAIYVTPEIRAALRQVEHLKGRKGSVADFEAAALWHIAASLPAGASVLEIGTLWGRTAALFSVGAPSAHVVTVNASRDEWLRNTRDLRSYPNISCWNYISWELLTTYQGSPFDLIFVDGDHRETARDTPWWKWLKPGGWMLFHDYSEAEIHVRAAVDALGAQLGRSELDLLVTDVDGVGRGLAGFQKRAGE